ncbi:Uu.00g051890.m01.CDS01 [Anthostomella pinea]|uniref:Uu.00g051890.m01.CDS01 n=1 Tax=Anthostomella pinea TaxID=933095 RepID=A0AAI8VW51_9PEZI|nr:Uu.00g051890.m01.CDS01 [Anthostomella pinea]
MKEPRPSPEHVRAIFFGASVPKPKLLWIRIPQHSSGGDMFNLRPDVMPLLIKPGETKYTYVGHSIIQRNMRMGSVYPGRVVQLLYRDSFLEDGSPRCRAMLAATQPHGHLEHDWRGPVVALAMNGPEYLDANPADLRSVIDYSVWYQRGKALNNGKDGNEQLLEFLPNHGGTKKVFVDLGLGVAQRNFPNGPPQQ